MINDFLNKRVFITGAFGFVGSHLIESLRARGAVIYALSGPDEQYTVADGGRVKNVFKEDIENQKAIFKIIDQVKPEIIYHLAAVTSVPYSKENPAKVVGINFNGTFNLLEAVRRNGKGKFVYVSSAEIYNKSDAPVGENCEIFPDSPYAASKAAADHLVFSYYQTYALPVFIFRPSNIYGPGNRKNVIFKFIDAALKDGVITVDGGEQIKDFIYIDDFVNALLQASSDDSAVGETFNVGSGKAIAIKELAIKIIGLANSQSRILVGEKRDIRSKNFQCNYDKINKMLGWKPWTGLEAGLLKTIDWAKQQNVKK